MQENLKTEWISVTDDEILTTACAFGIKEKVQNNQAIVKMFRNLEKRLIKRNEREL